MENIEQKYVVQFYDTHVRSFDETRYAAWPAVRRYVENLESNSLLCDIGCGNGKNQFRKDIMYVSCDSSKEMCKLVANCICACATQLPFDDSTFDHALCIAVIHHLSTHNRRLHALKEIKRILKANGTALISVWGNQHKYGYGDQLVDWNHSKNVRYIHFFGKTEIESLVQEVFEKYEIFQDYNNFFVVVKK